MSTKLNAEEIAANRFPTVEGEPLPLVQRGYYAAAITEVAQLLADERDEYREALEGIMELAYSSRIDQALDDARAILAKYPRP